MKKISTLAFVFALIAIIISSCSSKTDEVKQLLAKLATNEAALYKAYPDMPNSIELKGNLLNSAAVTVTETGEGEYDVALPEEATMRICLTDNGEIYIKETHRFLDISTKRYNMAIETGWIDKDMNDVEMAKRFADLDFEKWLAKEAIADIKKNLTCKITGRYGDEYFEGEWVSAEGIVVLVTNNTNLEIPYDAYEVIGRSWYWGDPNNKDIHKENGAFLTPKGTAEFRIPASPSTESDVDALLEFNDDILAKTALNSFEPKGGEYQKYKQR